MDASPLILLGKAGQLDWLPLMGTIIIPESVAEEITAGALDDPARIWLSSRDGKQFIKPDSSISEEILAWDLGRGENAVIACALAIPGAEAVIDDAAARRSAMVFGIRLRGSLSRIALAKKRGHISASRPVFGKMRAVGLYVSQALIEQVAASVGE